MFKNHEFCGKGLLKIYTGSYFHIRHCGLQCVLMPFSAMCFVQFWADCGLPWLPFLAMCCVPFWANICNIAYKSWSAAQWAKIVPQAAKNVRKPQVLRKRTFKNYTGSYFHIRHCGLQCVLMPFSAMCFVQFWTNLDIWSSVFVHKFKNLCLM